MTILDTVGGHLLHESEILPVLYVPLDDVDPGVLERSDHTTHCPFKGDACYWHVRVGKRLVENALWANEQPLPRAAWLEGAAGVRGLVSFLGEGIAVELEGAEAPAAA